MPAESCWTKPMRLRSVSVSRLRRLRSVPPSAYCQGGWGAGVESEDNLGRKRGFDRTGQKERIRSQGRA